MIATATPTVDDILPADGLTGSETAILAEARALAESTGRPLRARDVAARCHYARNYVRRLIRDLVSRGLWPWPYGQAPRCRLDRATLKARVAAVRRGDDPDDPEPAPEPVPVPVPVPAWFIGPGRRPGRLDDHLLLRGSRNYRRLVRLLRRKGVA